MLFSLKSLHDHDFVKLDIFRLQPKDEPFALNSLVITFFFWSPSISDALPEGLTRELPSADEYQTLPAEAPAPIDDLDDLRKQLEALNSA